MINIYSLSNATILFCIIDAYSNTIQLYIVCTCVFVTKNGWCCALQYVLLGMENLALFPAIP